MSNKLQIVRLDTQTAKGRTARETLLSALKCAREHDADAAIVILRHKDGRVQSHFGGSACGWIERVGMMEIAKIDAAQPCD